MATEPPRLELVKRALSELTLRPETFDTDTLAALLTSETLLSLSTLSRVSLSQTLPAKAPALWLPCVSDDEIYTLQDDADSGYHTGSNTLQSKAQRAAAAGGAGGAPQPVAPRPPGEWTLTREELRRQIEAFNNNNHGLIMSLQQETNTFQGFIRVHMNLIRPINMSLSARPASIYDVMGQSDDEESDTEAEITSFYLPKDTTKVIHINSSTTTQEVIRTLLSKFKITDNPRKFALYEKIQEEGKKDLMRRLEDAEQPLPCCLSWTLESLALLDKRKFVLQENDTGEIMWEAFSLPELENFLRILDREEDEYVDQVKAKYRMLRVQMQQRLKDLEPASEPPSGEDKREPVYV